MTSEQRREIDKLIDFLQADMTKPTNKASRREQSYRTLDALTTLRREHDDLVAFKQNVDEALNSGDGSYRP